ncbi:hypothetical protein PYW08_009427 [Mythimna loreyi]|uniref:Uncharacterized protein n=1 Tax=Mythimna loreyi TaxID=667449 RepID=A0ACC2Q958_9NEOP|nr:hypothetical protein PYW08_009427 [Mythimna loreyi]
MLRVWIDKVQTPRYTENTEEEYWNIINNAYFNIQEMYMIIERTFRQMIIFNTVFVAYVSLRNVAMVVIFRSLIVTKQPKFNVLLFVTQTWNMKNIIILICLSVECERFYAAIRDVQSCCVMLLRTRHCSDPERRLCKNIQRVQKATFQKMSACGLFNIDAKLPLQLSSFITTYAIVILQFVYL